MTTHAITRGTPPTLNARKPTGQPAWPMLLVAGGQKCGKTYTAAELSASDLVDRTFIVEVGEGMVDQYGAIPGARFEILEHDGTFLSIARQVWAATLVPRGESGKPHAIVLDSATEVWDLVSGEQQELSNQRRDRKNAQSSRPTADGAEDAVITMDQWNAAKKRWRALVDLLRSHDGPVIWTARFEEVAVIGGNGRPIEGQKAWKIRTEKNLPFEVDGIIEIPEPRKHYVTGIRSLRFQLDPGEKRLVPGFTIDAMLRALGLDEEVGRRHYTAPNTEAYLAEHAAEQAELAAAAQQPGQQAAPRGQQRPAATRRTAAQWGPAIDGLTTYEAARALYREAQEAGQLEVDVDGYTVAARIQGKGEQLRDAERKAAQGVMTGKPAEPAEPASAPAEAPAAPVPAQEAEQAPAAPPAAAEPVAPDVPTNDTDGQGGEGHDDTAAVDAGEELAEPDPIQSRRESARRKGTITALTEQWGNAETLDAAAVQEFRQTVANVSTQRLGDWLQSTIRENRGASA
jgi:hypothetical protein